jgi:hypothetical protein
MANTRETLASVLQFLQTSGLPCDVFGGWAEELLGLRRPWQHQDIDLIHRGDSFAAFDTIKGDFCPVPSKRFRHKRAFMFYDTLCEIILVRDTDRQPVTMYWGDVPFHWDRPLLHDGVVELCGDAVTVVSAANLEKHRRLHKETQPHRWQDRESLEP